MHVTLLIWEFLRSCILVFVYCHLENRIHFKNNYNRYNQQLARQRQLDDTGDWDDDLDPEDRARLMGRDFMGPRYR